MEKVLAVFFTDDNQSYANKYHNPMELKLKLDNKDHFIVVEKRSGDEYYLLQKSKIKMIHVRCESNGK